MANRTKWTKERYEALKKLADCSTTYRANGTPMFKKNWEEGLRKLEVADFAAYKLMKEIPLKHLSWTWTANQNNAYGYCATGTCKNKVIIGQRFCEEHKVAKTSRPSLLSKSIMRENMDIVEQCLAKVTGKEAKEILYENITYLPSAARKRVLGKMYIDLLTQRMPKI